MKPYKNERGQHCVDIALGDGTVKPFEFKKWGAEESTDTYLDLISVAGPALGGLAAIYTSGKGDDTDLGGDAIETLMRQLTTSLTGQRDLAKRLIVKLASQGVWCDGAIIKYDTFYADQIQVSFAVIRANLTVQYGDFLGAIGLIGDKSSSPVAKSPSP